MSFENYSKILGRTRSQRSNGANQEISVGLLEVMDLVNGVYTNYFVDGTNGSDSNSGLNWNETFATIQAAMDAVTALGVERGRSTIYVAPGGYQENIITPLNTVAPFGRLIAVNPTSQSFGAAWLLGTDVGGVTLTIRARGWLVEGFEIDNIVNGKGVLLDGLTANSSAQGAEIRNNILVGGNVAGIGLDVVGNGAPYAKLINNHFSGYKTNAISCSESGTDQPRFWNVQSCTFVDNDNHIDFSAGPRGMKESQVQYCSFLSVGANQSPTNLLNNLGGNGTIIGPGNFLGGDYDIASGYVPGANESWRGNHSQDSENGSAQANPA